MKIDNYYLDSNQLDIVYDLNRFILVIAGAGSGKTLTILGKINYLVKNLKYSENEILCISFTKASSTELKNKIKNYLNLDIDVYTFHKLAINILENDKKINICDSTLLEDIIHNYLYIDILKFPKQQKIVLYIIDVLFSFKDYLDIIHNNKKIIILERNIATFIRLFKCNGYDLNKFRELLIKKKGKYKFFLLITFNIYLLYRDYLDKNNEYDFDDLIIKATQKLKQKYNNYKYIIIDEYQDTSYIRFNLIKKIVDLNNAKLMAVGDDFQSIYRFTGCDIELFTNFNKYFKDAKTMYIPNTYRNSQELVSIAGRFIMTNKYQLKKELKSNKLLNKPVKIVYYNNLIEEVEKIITNISTNILFLGRNNKDINMLIDNNTFKYKDNSIIYKDKKYNYLTIHKSKGLECDNVIIINLTDDVLGFPSKLKEDASLKDIIKEDKYPFSEERRLFYVAITRTKNYVFLLTPYHNRSCFIKEIEKYKDVDKINKKIIM